MNATGTTLSIVLCSIVFTACVLASTENTGKKDPPPLRGSLCYMKIAGGLEFSIRSQARYSSKPQTLEVKARLMPGKDLMKTKWVVDKITTIDFPSKCPFYYALVNMKEDQIFIYFTWNEQYCVIDKTNGAILKRGRGEDSLKQYDQFVLLKLIRPCTWGGETRFPNEKGASHRVPGKGHTQVPSSGDTSNSTVAKELDGALRRLGDPPLSGKMSVA